MTGDPVAWNWPEHTCTRAWFGVNPPPPCPACRLAMCAPQPTYQTWTGTTTMTAPTAFTLPISDSDIERIAKRVAELLKGQTGG